MTGPRKRLGEILVDAGVLDAHQLQAALGHQKQWGGKLGRILVEKRFITEEIMLRAVSRQLSLDMVDLNQQKVHERVVALLTPEMVSKFNVVPVGVKREGSAEVLYLAMSDPTNVEALDTVAFRTGKKVRPLLASEASIEKAIRLYYLGETPVPTVQPVVEAQFGGHEVELTDDLPVLTGTAAAPPAPEPPPPPPAPAAARAAAPPPPARAPFQAAPAAGGGDWFLGDSTPGAPVPHAAPPSPVAPQSPSGSWPQVAPPAPSASSGVWTSPPAPPPPSGSSSVWTAPGAPPPAGSSGVWATSQPVQAPPPAAAALQPPPPAPTPPAAIMPVHTPVYGTPAAPPPPAIPLTWAVAAAPTAPAPAPPPAQAPAAPPPPETAPAFGGAGDWGAQVDDAAPRALDPLELPPDDGAPMELAGAHEFLGAAAQQLGGNAWVKPASVAHAPGGELEFEDNAVVDLELAFDPPSRAQQPTPQQPMEVGLASDLPPVVAAGTADAWDSDLGWGAALGGPAPAEPPAAAPPPVEPAPQAPPALPPPPAALDPARAAAPVAGPTVEAAPPPAAPPPPEGDSWGDAMGGLAAPPHTPHAWAAPAQDAAMESGWMAALPQPAEPALSHVEAPALAPPVLVEAPPLPPAAAVLHPPAVAPETAIAQEPPAAAPPVSSLLDALPAPPPPSAPAVSQDLSATAPGAGGLDLLGAPRMLTNEFSTLSTVLDPTLERSGRFPAVAVPANLLPGLPPATPPMEPPAWDVALAPPPPEPALVPPPPASGGGLVFGAGEVVTDPVSVRAEPSGGNVAMDMPVTAPGESAPASAAPAANGEGAELSWGALADAAAPAAPAAPTPAETAPADDAGLAWEAADLLEGLPAPQDPVPPAAAAPEPAASAAVAPPPEPPAAVEPPPPAMTEPAMPAVPEPPPPAMPEPPPPAAVAPPVAAAGTSLLPPLEAPPAAAPRPVDPLANVNLESSSVVSLARLFIKKGLLSEDEVKEALSKPPEPRDKG